MMQEENQAQTKENKDDCLLSCLNNSYTNKKIACIYTNMEQTTRFMAGIVSQIFENEVIINHFMPNGKYDGYVVKQLLNFFTKSQMLMEELLFLTKVQQQNGE